MLPSKPQPDQFATITWDHVHHWPHWIPPDLGRTLLEESLKSHYSPPTTIQEPLPPTLAAVRDLVDPSQTCHTCISTLYHHGHEVQPYGPLQWSKPHPDRLFLVLLGAARTVRIRRRSDRHDLRTFPLERGDVLVIPTHEFEYSLLPDLHINTAALTLDFL